MSDTNHVHGFPWTIPGQNGVVVKKNNDYVELRGLEPLASRVRSQPIACKHARLHDKYLDHGTKWSKLLGSLAGIGLAMAGPACPAAPEPPADAAAELPGPRGRYTLTWECERGCFPGFSLAANSVLVVAETSVSFQRPECLDCDEVVAEYVPDAPCGVVPALVLDDGPEGFGTAEPLKLCSQPDGSVTGEVVFAWPSPNRLVRRWRLLGARDGLTEAALKGWDVRARVCSLDDPAKREPGPDSHLGRHDVEQAQPPTSAPAHAAEHQALTSPRVASQPTREPGLALVGPSVEQKVPGPVEQGAGPARAANTLTLGLAYRAERDSLVSPCSTLDVVDQIRAIGTHPGLELGLARLGNPKPSLGVARAQDEALAQLRDERGPGGKGRIVQRARSCEAQLAL